MPLFLRCFFLRCFLFLCHRLFPPFNPQRAEMCEELGMTSLHLHEFSNHHIFFVKHYSHLFENIFTSVCAINFFGARGIFLVSPFRNKTITSFSSLSIPESELLTSFATMMSQCFA